MKNVLDETDKCVRCGACKANCPTYIEGLSEAFSARGRVIITKKIIEGHLKPSDSLIEDIYSCLLCDACKSQCPLEIDIASIIYEGRKHLLETDRRRKHLRWLVSLMINYPSLSFRVSRMLRNTLYPYLHRKGIIPFNLHIPDEALRDEHQVLRPNKKKGRIAIFVGCSVNYLMPHLGLSLINVLLRIGYEIVLPKGEVCCGAPLLGLGLKDNAIKMARKNLSIFGNLNVEAILTLCPTCLLSVKYHYRDLTGEALERAMDVSQFFEQKLKDLESRISSITDVSYHDPCHHINSMGISKEPRKLLTRSGIKVIEMDEQGCCGFAGLFSLNYKELSKTLLQKRIDLFRKTNARGLVTACPGCIMQLASEIKNTPVYHIVEILEQVITAKPD